MTSPSGERRFPVTSWRAEARPGRHSFQGNGYSSSTHLGRVGPGVVATWGRATANRVDGFGYLGVGRQVQQTIPFNWSGPEQA